MVLYELFLAITSNTAVVVEAGNIDSYNEYFEANGVDLSYFIKCVNTEQTCSCISYHTPYTLYVPLGSLGYLLGPLDLA